MKKAPSIIQADNLVSGFQIRTFIDTKQSVLARPEGYFSLLHRIKCAWLVFTGKADVLTWYKQ